MASSACPPLNCRWRPLRQALLLSLGGLQAVPAAAVPFNLGQLEGNLDSTLAVEVDWAMSAPDQDLIGSRNGGRAPAQTNDDGRLNFARGAVVSQRFNGWHGLELRHGDSGVFVSGHYWYDTTLMDEQLALYAIDEHGRQRGAKASGGEILDAFAYHNYQLDGPQGELSGDWRLGRQRLDWSASRLLENPLNGITPLDRQALHRPATAIAAAALPVNLLHWGQSLTPEWRAELFYQLDWQADVQDNCGTFFAASDVQAAGCDTRLAVAGSDFQPQAAAGYRYVPRQADRDARDAGQYGLALHWLAAALGDSELGLYALQYHSRAAFFGTQVGQGAAFDPVTGASSAQYRMVYPEAIRFYGLSVARQQGGTRLFAQLGYRPNMPLQLNGNDLTLAALEPLAGQNSNPLLLSGYASGVAGSSISGYQRKPVTQVQLGLTQVVEQVLAAQQLSLQFELGYEHLGGVDDSALRFGRDTAYGSGQLADNRQCAALNPQGAQACNQHGFYTAQAWGYRARATLEYADVWPGLDLLPSLALAHDLSGYSPTFNQDSKAVGLELSGVLQDSYSASLSYNSFFGGAYNPRRDRDFLAFSVGLSF